MNLANVTPFSVHPDRRILSIRNCIGRPVRFTPDLGGLEPPVLVIIHHRAM
jgi:hypothetical protein